MPKRSDIKKIMIIGAGPIVIGQACEFDYSGSQACKALKEEGYEVVLVNSNPATIMTDPGIADATYIEPLTTEFLELIIRKERPDAILPTLGGQTGLNLAMKLHEQGILTKYNVEMLGAKYEVIRKAEDRSEFKAAAIKVGLDVPKSVFAYNLEEAKLAVTEIGFPCIVRASFTLGGTGGGIAHDTQEFERIAALGIESSMIHEILIEESIEGWKEYELEVMRDHSDNVVIVCSIENLDPMGVHTGDSITVAPAQTLTDTEYQAMRDASIRLIREIGVETGGSNIQFAVDPRDGRMVVIEMNPRVSRSSALASKATGFPIAKFAAKLAVGYSLDEIQNDITRETPACFEPAIDYVVVKIPRFTFEKFPEAKDILGIQMKSVGETMAIGRNFKEALQKGLRGLEIDHIGLDNKQDWRYIEDAKIQLRLAEPNASRIFYLKYALQKGMSIEQVSAISKIDIWFVDQIAQILELEDRLISAGTSSGTLGPELLRQAKEYGFSDAQLAEILNKSEKDVRTLRKDLSITATFKLVDTCAAEFEAYTPYYYSTYETEDEALINNQKRKSKKKKIMILGGGPNRIGQGIEFDYCCCHAAFALKEMGFETIMVNSNPETVSTDYDTSDRLYFEPLTFEDVMNVFEVERPDGVIVQFGGQTPLNLARRLSQAGVPIIGTSVDSIDLAENREHFSKLIDTLGLRQPANASTVTKEETLLAAARIGYPVLVRPSYVLGGRAMRIVYDEESIKSFLDEVHSVSRGHPVLIDKFLEDAQEVDVDAICDGKDVYVAGVMEHIENAGIHSGDSACVLPPHTLSEEVIEDIKSQTVRLAHALKVVGLMNIQFAVKGRQVYILEVNPRASRTTPFVSKATGMALAKIAAQVMAGKKLSDFELVSPDELKYICVKESVLPFSRFSGVDIILGPEMKSTGEVMGIASSFGAAFAKSQMAANQALPKAGTVFISVNDHDKRDVAFIAKKLADLKFKVMATKGTSKVLRTAGVDVTILDKHHEGENNALTLVKKGEINLIINTPSGKKSQSDMRVIRAAAILHNIPCITTLQGAWAAVNGIEASLKEEFTVESLQDLYGSKSKGGLGMCGIVGISHHKEASKMAFLGLYALQHRGEEAAGIVSYDGREMHVIKKDGLAVDNFDENNISRLKGHMAIAHTRYSTTGGSHTKNIQPILVNHRKKPIAVAHNGNLTNTDDLYAELENAGSIFQTSMDSEIFVHLLAKTPNGDMAKWLTNVFSQVKGAYSVVLLLDESLIGARDPHGFRPLCLGKLGDGYILASESCAFDLMKAEFVREIAPGEIVIIKGNKLESIYLPGSKKEPKAFCVFENVYFARPDSRIFDDNIYQVRKRLGAQLAIEHPAKADFVLGIPDSGNYAALGYAQQLNMPFELGIVRNHYIGRTFIQPTQFLREFRVRVKLNPIKDVIKGKKVVVIEDSIVRGTTSRSRIEEIREAGAKEIHMRISCPPIKSPCFYGIDFPSTGELIAHNKKVQEIADFIKVDSLGFLSLEGMLGVMKDKESFCSACFTGKYPTAIPKNTDKLKLEA